MVLSMEPWIFQSKKGMSPYPKWGRLSTWAFPVRGLWSSRWAKDSEQQLYCTVVMKRELSWEETNEVTPGLQLEIFFFLFRIWYHVFQTVLQQFSSALRPSTAHVIQLLSQAECNSPLIINELKLCCPCICTLWSLQVQDEASEHRGLQSHEHSISADSNPTGCSWHAPLQSNPAVRHTDLPALQLEGTQHAVSLCSFTVMKTELIDGKFLCVFRSCISCIFLFVISVLECDQNRAPTSCRSVQVHRGHGSLYSASRLGITVDIDLSCFPLTLPNKLFLYSFLHIPFLCLYSSETCGWRHFVFRLRSSSCLHNFSGRTSAVFCPNYNFISHRLSNRIK